MFELNEGTLRAIHSLGQSEGGKLLVGLLDSSIEVAMVQLTTVSPLDMAAIAKQQAVVEICQGFKQFFEKDIETLLLEYGIEQEEENDG